MPSSDSKGDRPVTNADLQAMFYVAHEKAKPTIRKLNELGARLQEMTARADPKDPR